MPNDIYDPLTEYAEVFKDRFKDVAEKTFAELADEAQVDVEANRETCRQIYSTQESLSDVKSQLNWWTFGCWALWILAGVLVIMIFVKAGEAETSTLFLLGLAAVLISIYLFMKVHPRMRELKAERDDLSATVGKLKDEAWGQMQPLNRLYDWDILTRMMTQTVPKLEFDPYFTTQRLADLQNTYGWDGSFNRSRSVIYSHSGLINGNPFIICRTRKMVMGSKTYYGEKVITWTTRERGADGKYQTVHHSETLVASVTADYPEYPERTRLIYGNTAAPDLIFTRRQSGLAGREKSLSFKWQKHSLRKKARNLTDSDFAMLTNEEFEVAFNTSNRNNNQQYALLFTPLAQESMMNLLMDEEVGFGDDFDFYKSRMINTIDANHMQKLNLDLNPNLYRNFDYDKAEEDFYTINAHYFKAIYFCLAPLLTVPLYQQMRPLHDIYGRDMACRSAFWEHEALANFWGESHFEHPDCVTHSILKTEQHATGDGGSMITVYAHGYRVKQRLTYIKKYGGDGRWHNVPVYWDEYLPVTGEGQYQMKEDNEFDDGETTHRQRLDHINNVLENNNLKIYRRHIASKV